MNTKQKGDKYEEKAAEFLKERSYKILERNYRNKQGEIDIIAAKGGQIVFVEVKYRETSKFGYGAEAVDRKKLLRIYRTAMIYLTEKNLEDVECRFDCISYLGDSFKWDKNIVWGDEIGF